MNPFIVEDFGGADLGDKRLNRRLLKIAGQLYQKPDVSPTAACGGCGGWADTTAAFRFFDNERVRAEKIFESHHQGVLQRINAH